MRCIQFIPLKNMSNLTIKEQTNKNCCRRNSLQLNGIKLCENRCCGDDGGGGGGREIQSSKFESTQVTI